MALAVDGIPICGSVSFSAKEYGLPGILLKLDPYPNARGVAPLLQGLFELPNVSYFFSLNARDHVSGQQSGVIGETGWIDVGHDRTGLDFGVDSKPPNQFR